MSSVTLVLVVLGSEFPRRARERKAEGEGPIKARCPGTEPTEWGQDEVG